MALAALSLVAIPLGGAAAATAVWLLLTEAIGLDDPVSQNGPWIAAFVLSCLVVLRVARRRDDGPAPVIAALVGGCAIMFIVWTFVVVVGVLVVWEG